jgi:hypothetical protein
VTEEVIAGQRSLAEAIQVFRTLDRQWLPANIKQHVIQMQGMSEDEWYGQIVLFYVQEVLAARPDEAAAGVGCLEKELQERLASRQKRPAAPAEPRIAERSR